MSKLIDVDVLKSELKNKCKMAIVNGEVYCSSIDVVRVINNLAENPVDIINTAAEEKTTEIKRFSDEDLASISVMYDALKGMGFNNDYAAKLVIKIADVAFKQ